MSCRVSPSRETAGTRAPEVCPSPETDADTQTQSSTRMPEGEGGVEQLSAVATLQRQQEQAFRDLIAQGLSRKLLQLLFMTMAMAAFETDSPRLLSMIVVDVTLLGLMNLFDAIPSLPIAIVATIVCAVVIIRVLISFRETTREIEDNDKKALQFDAAAKKLGLDVAEDLGPKSRLNPDLKQHGDKGVVTLNTLLPWANELLPSYKERVIKPVASAGFMFVSTHSLVGREVYVRSTNSGLKKGLFEFHHAQIQAAYCGETGIRCTVKYDDRTEESDVEFTRVGSLESSAGVKGELRSREKAAVDYGGDGRMLKDLLRASVICDTFAQLLLCLAAINALVDEGVISIAQIKNRFNDGCCGYKDINFNIEFEGMICELQLHLRTIYILKEQAHKSYEVCRELGLCGELPQFAHEEDVVVPLVLRIAPGLLRWCAGGFAMVYSVMYVAAGEIGARDGWFWLGGDSSGFQWWHWACVCAPPFATLEYLLFRDLCSGLSAGARVFAAVGIAVWVSLAMPQLIFFLRYGWTRIIPSFATFICGVVIPLAALSTLFCPGKAQRPSRVATLYRRYFGVSGMFFEQKMLASQFTTVILQAAFRLPLVSAAARMNGRERGGLVPVGPWTYWAFLTTLILNTIVPSLLLSFDNSRVRREGTAAYDIGSDMFYCLFGYLGISATSHQAVIPTGIGVYFSSIFPLLHILSTTRALERAVEEDLKAKRRAKERIRIGHRLSVRTTVIFQGRKRASGSLLRGFKLGAVVALLGVVFGFTLSDRNFGPHNASTTPCGPCQCSTHGALIDCMRTRRTVHAMRVLGINEMGLQAKNVLKIEIGAFRRYRDIEHVRGLNLQLNNIVSLERGVFDGLNHLKFMKLMGNNIKTIYNGTFSGLNSLEYLYLAYNKVTTIEPGAFDGLGHLKQINFYGNPLSCADVDDELPRSVLCVD